MKVSILVHHGGTLKGSPLTYTGGEVYNAKRVEFDFLTLVDVWDVMQVLGYNREHRFWYVLGNDSLNDLRRVSNDLEIIGIINRVEFGKKSVEHGIDIPDVIDDCKPSPALTLFEDIARVEASEEGGDNAGNIAGVEASEEVGVEAKVEAGVAVGVEVEGADEADVRNGPEADRLFDLQETNEEDEDLYAEANTNANSSIGGERWFGAGDTETVDGGSDIDSDAPDGDALDSMSKRKEVMGESDVDN